jgi:hypothetical protein
MQRKIQSPYNIGKSIAIKNKKMDYFNQIWKIASPRDDFEVSPKRKNCIVNCILTPFDNNQESISSIKASTISQFQNKCSIVSSPHLFLRLLRPF